MRVMSLGQQDEDRIDISCFHDWFFKHPAQSPTLSLCLGELGGYMFQMKAVIYKRPGSLSHSSEENTFGKLLDQDEAIT